MPRKENPADPYWIPYPPVIKRGNLRAIQHLAAYASGKEETPPPPSVCKDVLDWIINEACKAYDVPFFANDAGGRKTAFMGGRQYVAKQIISLMQLRPENFEE
jgi:hypothetical protein